MRKSKTTYSNPLGYRMTDRVEPFVFGVESYRVNVLSYDTDIFKNVNEFIGRYTFFFTHYMKFLDKKNERVRIEEFLKDNHLNGGYIDDKIIKTTFTQRGNNIFFEKGGKEGECYITGIFSVDNYKVFCASSYMFFRDKFTNEQFIYSGGLI